LTLFFGSATLAGAAAVCQWTWMCAPPPVGPNIHANVLGYGVIAEAFHAVLPPLR
jgi:hypothetical protein